MLKPDFAVSNGLAVNTVDCVTIQNCRDGSTTPPQASERLADADPPRSCTNESAMMPYIRMTNTELMTSEASCPTDGETKANSDPIAPLTPPTTPNRTTRASSRQRLPLASSQLRRNASIGPVSSTATANTANWRLTARNRPGTRRNANPIGIATPRTTLTTSADRN